MTQQIRTARRRREKGTPLFDWRMKHGITQQDAAKLFGVSFSTYRRYEALKPLPKFLELAFGQIKENARK